MTLADQQADIRSAIRKVPIISSAASKILERINDPEHSLADIVNIIKHDAAMTSHVLKVVNSAAYGRRAVINSIERAVSLLGEDLLVGIAMSEAASHLFNRRLEGYAADAGDLWRHDLQTAIASKKIAGFTAQKVNGDLAFTCGLLHDLGKAVISDFLKNTPAKISMALDQGKCRDYLDAERRILGMDHAEVGYELAIYWQLPEPLPMVIRHHHLPTAAPAELKPLVYAVHLGDMIAMMAGCGTGADTMRYALDGAYVEHMKLEEDTLALIVLEVAQEYAAIAKSLQIEGGGN